ncbi:MAG: hypothetical protein U0136_00045 [Bdellovibrionota bacterium]
MSEHSAVDDPCGSYGPTQRWAIVWFFAVILIGISAAFTFKNTDSYMYATGAENFDYKTYRETRLAQTSQVNDNVDERAQGDYATAVQRVTK